MTVAPPLVSVLVAVHDGEPFLGTAVRSVLRQTVSALELVVVDDASTDETANVLAAIGDPRLVVVRNETQQGLAASLNRGLESSRSRYVARLDADDVAMPRRLERQLARMRSRPPVAVVGSGTFELDDAGSVGRLHLMPAGPLACRWAALFSSPFFHPSVLVDREVLDRHELRYDAEFPESEDYDLWTRLLAVADGDNVPEPLVLYRVHAGQASHRRRELQREYQRRVAMREIERYLPAHPTDRRELAFRLGAGERLEPTELEDAVEALAALAEAFERVHPGPAARRAAAHAIARAARHASPGARGRLLQHALGLDPLLAGHAAAASARRRREARAAGREAREWLDDLRANPELTTSRIRVLAVFPEPTPYRAPLLDRVAEYEEIDLTVVYAAETVAGRTWDVEPRHRARFLRGLRVPGAERVLHHDYPVTPGIARELERGRPDVVVVSGWSTFASQAAIAWCRARDVPYVLVVESHDEGPRAGWRKTVKRTVVPPIVRVASGVLVTGSLARSSMIDRGADPERIGIFANTIDVDAFTAEANALAPERDALRGELGAGPDDVVVLSVARLAPEKGLDLLVRAVAEAADPRLLVAVAGEGPERERLTALASELGVRLVLTGDLPWARIVEAYVMADVFALLSEREPWAVVVNEAAACGLPLVLSDHVGAAHDLLRDGENGALVPAGDVAAAAGALRRLAADRLVRLAYGAASREIAAAWGYGPSAYAFVAAVRRAVSERVGG